MSKYAIVSVYDKSGLEEFVRGLTQFGVEILSTGGTAQFLLDKGFKVQLISDYTGQQEVLDGRVKTLHPKIHAGILARRSRSDDMEQLKQAGIFGIDFVVVNLYPFTEQVAKVEAEGNSEHSSLVEYIDIGGPTMIRAAAKNCADVVPICDPRDYSLILDQLASGAVNLALRQQLAAKVFYTMATYDAAVARYYSLGEKLLDENGNRKQLAPIEALVIQREENLRYGENPHQIAALYHQVSLANDASVKQWKQLQGKEISYNNILDAQAALDLLFEFLPGLLANQQAAVVIKHSNPCGVAIRPTTVEAFRVARECDPVSAFGGIVAISGKLDAEVAESIVEGFVEVVLFAEYTEEALKVFAKKKNVRLLHCDFKAMQENRKSGWLSVRNFAEEFLLQSFDNSLSPVSSGKVVTGGDRLKQLSQDFEFAWKVSKHVKSNAIVIVKDQKAIGVGAGQMNRVDSARIAIQRAKTCGHVLVGSVAASDAFLPFPDTLEVLSEVGVCGLVQPGGSINDDAVIKLAEEKEVVMVFTGERHFRH